MAIRGLASPWLNNGNHGLRSRFTRNSKIIELTTDHGATDLWMKSDQIDRRFSFRAIWSRKLQALGLIAFLTVVVWLCSCDANLFGPESREIAGGYRLKRANNLNEFALTIPNEDGGLIIDEIGWREPLIFANLALTRFSAEEQRRIGIHTCPGSDRDSTSDRNIEDARAESEGYGRPRLLIARATLSHRRQQNRWRSDYVGRS
jgi:hypothetical protein